MFINFLPQMTSMNLRTKRSKVFVVVWRWQLLDCLNMAPTADLALFCLFFSQRAFELFPAISGKTTINASSSCVSLVRCLFPTFRKALAVS